MIEIENVLNSVKNKYNNKCILCSSNLVFYKNNYMDIFNISCKMCYSNQTRNDNYYFDISCFEKNYCFFCYSIKFENKIYSFKIYKENFITHLSYNRLSNIVLSSEKDYDPIISIDEMKKICDNLIFC